MTLYNAVSALRICVWSERANFSFFALFKRFVCPAAHAVELHRFRERQLHLRIGQGSCPGFCALAEAVAAAAASMGAFRRFRKADVVELLQRRKVFKQWAAFAARCHPARMCGGPPFFHLVASVGLLPPAPRQTNAGAEWKGILPHGSGVAQLQPLHAGARTGWRPPLPPYPARRWKGNRPALLRL